MIIYVPALVIMVWGIGDTHFAACEYCVVCPQVPVPVQTKWSRLEQPVRMVETRIIMVFILGPPSADIVPGPDTNGLEQNENDAGLGGYLDCV